MKHQKQKWFGHDRRVIITDQFEGSVQLLFFNEPQGKRKIVAYIQALWVEPQHRGKGHARNLLSEAERVAAESGHDAIYLEWDKREAEVWTLEWYLRQGYEEVEFGNNGSLLRKQLSK